MGAAVRLEHEGDHAGITDGYKESLRVPEVDVLRPILGDAERIPANLLDNLVSLDAQTNCPSPRSCPAPTAAPIGSRSGGTG